MNNQILTSLSIITAFHNNGKSVLDAFLPLVEYGIATLNVEKETNHYDILSLQEKIFNSTGVKINIISLKSLLKRIKKDGKIELIGKEQYFRIVLDKKPKQDEYLEAIREKHRDVHKFIKEFIKYSDDIRQEDEITIWIYDFLKQYRQLISIDKSDVSIKDSLLDGKQYEKFIKFLQHINESENELIRIFKNIYYGFGLCSLLETNNNEIQNLKLNNLTIYADSNFILRLLDLQEENYTKETCELFEIFKYNKVQIYVLQETIDEIKNVLKYYLERYKNNKEYYHSVLEMPDHINGVLGAYFRKHLTISQIENIIDGISQEITRLGIKTDNIERYKIQIANEEIEKLYNEKYFDKDQDENRDYRKQKCLHYLQIIKIMKFLRKTHNSVSSCLGNSKYVFLTCDLRLYNYSKKNAYRVSTYPEIITQEIISNDLFLFNPQDTGNISIGLMIALFNNSDYIDVHILDKLANTIEEISNESPDIVSYVIMATRNSENYNEINKIYTEDDNQKKRLIELAKRVKQDTQKDKEIKQKEITEKELAITDAKTQIQRQDNEILSLKNSLKEANITINKDVEFRKTLHDKAMRKWTIFYKTASIILCIIFALASIVGSVFSMLKLESPLNWLGCIACGIVAIGLIIGAIIKGKDNVIVNKLIQKKEKQLLKKYNLEK